MIDLVIIGAGPAGLTGAIYAARSGLDFLVLEQDGVGGGQITAAHEIENYPGLGRISGEALGDAFRTHAESLGAEITYAVVERVEPLAQGFRIHIEDEAAIETRAVLAATGAVPSALGVPGEHLASYCAVCDGAFYTGRDVLVVGGGDTAVEDALCLAGICNSVTVALRRDTFRAARSRVELLLAKPNVTVLYEAKLREIQGSKNVEQVLLELKDGFAELPMAGVFIAVGVEPVSTWLHDLPLKFDDGYVVAGEDCRTEIPGFYVAGDLRKKPLRQVATAVADGANAVTSAVSDLLVNS